MKKPKPEPVPDDPKQSEAFIKKAKEIEADEAGTGFHRFIEAISPLPNSDAKTPPVKKNTGEGT